MPKRLKTKKKKKKGLNPSEPSVPWQRFYPHLVIPGGASWLCQGGCRGLFWGKSPISSQDLSSSTACLCRTRCPGGGNHPPGAGCSLSPGQPPRYHLAATTTAAKRRASRLPPSSLLWEDRSGRGFYQLQGSSSVVPGRVLSPAARGLVPRGLSPKGWELG